MWKSSVYKCKVINLVGSWIIYSRLNETTGEFVSVRDSEIWEIKADGTMIRHMGMYAYIPMIMAYCWRMVRTLGSGASIPLTGFRFDSVLDMLLFLNGFLYGVERWFDYEIYVI